MRGSASVGMSANVAPPPPESGAALPDSGSVTPEEGVARGGCGYRGYEFGAGYLDSMCIEGYLWDADSCDEPGGGLTQGGDIPCPHCNKREWKRWRAA